MKTMARLLPILLTFALVCFALVQNAQAVNPPPDGGYPGGNTAEGHRRPFKSRPRVFNNTAIGFFSLKNDHTRGAANTAVGAGHALFEQGSRAKYSHRCGRHFLSNTNG